MRIIREFIETNFLEELYEDSTLACEKLLNNELESSNSQQVSECYDDIRSTLLKLKTLSDRLKTELTGNKSG